jgi:flagellar hook-associated protein 1 FlgK
VASTLTQIRDLNEQIRAVSISGRNPNDLMDRRDLLLDNLSKRFSFEKKDTEYNGIEIIPKPLNKEIGAEIGAGPDKDGVILKDTNLNYGVAYVNKITKTGDDSWEIELHMDGNINKSTKVTTDTAGIKNYLTNTDITSYTTGSELPYSSYLKVVNYEYDEYDSKLNKFNDETNVKLFIPDYENGSLNGLQTINDEIDNYKDQLNNMARILAISVNTIQTNSTDSTKEINFFDSKAETASEAAKSLRVNNDILTDVSKINAGKDIGGNAGNGERALLMGTLRNTRIDILGINNTDISSLTTDKEKVEAYRKAFIKDVFKDKDGNAINDASGNLADDKNIKMNGNSSGTTIDAYFKNSIASLGVSNQEAKKMVSNEKALLSQLNERKESTSGVSLDEEVTNMIQFSKSYQANAKMISVIDELLDVVVNGLIKR